MPATGFKGVDSRQSGLLVFEVSLKDANGAKVTTGTTTYRLFEEQSDGTLKSYDFSDNTFKTTALTTATATMSHRTGDNGTYNTGIWTAALATVTGFTRGANYIVQASNSNASPVDQERKFVYGEQGGDLVCTSTGGVNLGPAGLDGIAVESGINGRQALSGILAASVGKVSGAGTTTIIVKGANNNTTRIEATVDVPGNRSAVTLTLPA